MGKTLTEKILARACGNPAAHAGEIVNVRVNRLMMMDWKCDSIFGYFEEDLGQTVLQDPDRIVMVSDHLGVGHTAKNAQTLDDFRIKAEQYHVKHFYGVGRTGICHQMMVEEGLVTPGSVSLGTDSHSTTYGSLGAFSCGVSTTEAAVIMATGEIWFRIPSTVRVVLDGTLPFGCYGKDVALKILTLLRCDEAALYKAIEIVGDGVASLSVDDRIAICNMMAETGAKNCIIPADEVTDAYLKGRLETPYEHLRSDEDASFDETFRINLDELEPMIAVPPLVYDARPVRELEGTPITRAFFGSCTSGRLEELRIGAELVSGREISPKVAMLVVPASKRIYIQCAEAGYIAAYAKAGASFESPSCACCAGFNCGLLPDNAVCVSTSNRNYNGRMGSQKASIYLASAATVVASALNGCITDPRPALRELSQTAGGNDK